MNTTIRQLADRLGVSKQAIWHWIAKLGLEVTYLGDKRTIAILNDDAVKRITAKIQTKGE